MSKSKGGWDLDFVGGLDQKHECPICLLCQREPHQTSCGHRFESFAQTSKMSKTSYSHLISDWFRFCHSCIITWLEDGKTCPGDNSTLGEVRKIEPFLGNLSHCGSPWTILGLFELQFVSNWKSSQLKPFWVRIWATLSLVGPILINLILLDSASPENNILTQLNVEPAGLNWVNRNQPL